MNIENLKNSLRNLIQYSHSSDEELLKVIEGFRGKRIIREIRDSLIAIDKRVLELEKILEKQRNK